MRNHNLRRSIVMIVMLIVLGLMMYVWSHGRETKKAHGVPCTSEEIMQVYDACWNNVQKEKSEEIINFTKKERDEYLTKEVLGKVSGKLKISQDRIMQAIEEHESQGENEV